MINRFPSVKVLDYCYSPIQIRRDDGEKVLVPCGKCNGCLLHKSNSWCFRLEDEITACPFPLFVTLTYYNKYLPHFSLYMCSKGISGARFYHYTDKSVLPYRNLRRVYSRVHDSFYEVERDDELDDVVSDDLISLPIRNLLASHPEYYFAYASKRDLQLFKKQLKSLLLYYAEKGYFDVERTNFRSFFISEYGPQTLRPHLHGILFFRDETVARFVRQNLLAKAWPMSDSTLLTQFATFTNKGVGEYVSSYVTQFSLLPRFIGENKQIRPFRLSSKSPSVGFIACSPDEIYEKVSVGIIEYHKTIPDVEQNFILRYPSLFVGRLFPKCRGYRFLSFEGLLRIYGLLWRFSRKAGRKFDIFLTRFRSYLPAQDYYASLTCLRFCLSYCVHPFHYCFLLDMYYYKVDMLNLRDWYQWQSEQMSCGNIQTVINSYSNLYDLLHSLSPSRYLRLSLGFFAMSFGVPLSYLRDLSYVDLHCYDDAMIRYIDEVDDIVINLDKGKKVNAQLGCSPDSNF